MKLTGIFSPVKTEKVQEKRTESVAAAKVDSAKSGATDRVQLSAGSLEVQKAKDIIDQTPEIRMDKVQALKDQLARGEYTVDPHKLVGKMLASLLSDNPPN